MEKEKQKATLTRDPLVQGMLFDAALKDSFILYTFQFVVSLLTIVLCTVFGKTVMYILSAVQAFMVIVMVMIALRFDLESIDKGLAGDSEGAGLIDRKKSWLVRLSIYAQVVSMFFYIGGLLSSLYTP